MGANKLLISRQQLSKICGGDYNAIRQFETLFQTSGEMTVSINTDAAGAVYPVWVSDTGSIQAHISPGRMAFTPSTGALVAGSVNGITGLATMPPPPNSSADPGTSTRAAREDHRHADGWATGDVKFSMASAAPSGWVLMNDGTIGDAASTATTRANDDCHALFVLIWGNVADSWCPVSGGRGASAEADWAAHKTLTLPRALGRALAVAGAGSGLTSRALGEYLGEEGHALTEAETGPHTHIQNAHTHIQDPHTHSAVGETSARATGANTGWGISAGQTNALAGVQSATATNQSATATNQSAGGGQAHNNMPPTLFLNVMVHL